MVEFFSLPDNRIELPDIDTGGRILDIGGGGEGIIGLLKGDRVVAIDPNRRELEETSNDSLMILMDACDLKFLDESFELVTSFFTLMYIHGEKWGTVFREVHRVLKDGGEFWIWDASFHIPRTVKENICMIPLKVVFPDGSIVDTGYGCRIHDQDLEDFEELARANGFEIQETSREGDTFFLKLKRLPK
ncbi:MAG: class I SAM-dependent methyltransferase [Theionarchaea archaeon]|nr:class I SAM-dependent methyltransferase [Theionarchaea archaeon]